MAKTVLEISRIRARASALPTDPGRCVGCGLPDHICRFKVKRRPPKRRGRRRVASAGLLAFTALSAAYASVDANYDPSIADDILGDAPVRLVCRLQDRYVTPADLAKGFDPKTL